MSRMGNSITLDPAAESTVGGGNEFEIRELRALMDDIFEMHGLDFRNYSYSSLRRRVLNRVDQENAGTIAGLHQRAQGDAACMERLLTALTIHVTSMFRDPGFYLALRGKVLPVLRTYPYLRLWIAGCSTGEEIYSLAVLLHEEDLYSRCRIYATDLSETVLEKARAGVFPLSQMQEYTRNYQKAGGRRDFSEYYTADDGLALFRPFLRENVVFALHNLVSDASFNEFHAILCRNVLIYFDRSLQGRVHNLFHDSLVMFGYLGLGRSESVRFTSHEKHYDAVFPVERIFRKIG